MNIIRPTRLFRTTLLFGKMQVRNYFLNFLLAIFLKLYTFVTFILNQSKYTKFDRFRFLTTDAGESLISKFGGMTI